MRIFLFLFITCFSFMTAQEDSVYAKIDSSFSEGIYLTVNDFRTNAPIKIDSFNVKKNNESRDIHTRLTTNSQFSCTVNGVKKVFATRAVWGYYSNKKLYVQKSGKFFLMVYPGTICLFSALNQETEFRTTRVTTHYGSSSNTSYRQTSTTGPVLRPYLVSIYQGRVISGKQKNLGKLLKSDPQVYSEYLKAKPIDISEMKSLVLKYNARHPLYILKK